MQRKIKKRRVYERPIREVWEAITSGSKLERWFMENNFVAEEGARFEFFDKPGEKWRGMYQGEIISCQPPMNLAMSWTHNKLKHTTYVWWRLDEDKDKTIVSLEHSGFKGFKDYLSSFGYSKFWDVKLRDLLQFFINEQNRKDPIRI